MHEHVREARRHHLALEFVLVAFSPDDTAANDLYNNGLEGRRLNYNAELAKDPK